MKVCKNCDKPLSNPRSIFCSKLCQREFEYKLWIKRWKNKEETGMRGEYAISNYIRKYLLDKYDSKCARCGWGEVNHHTGRIPLEIEHIDGNFKNNSEENLILLCPNCHSLTSTYKGANKGNGRKSRVKYN